MFEIILDSSRPFEPTMLNSLLKFKGIGLLLVSGFSK